ncbi:MAG: hypothetical protein WAO02_11470 [Verrucomicrobiia bacterium]
MSNENDSARTFQQLRDRLAGEIKRVRAADARGLPLDTLTAEAGRIMATLHQFMEQHKGTPLYDAY